MNSIYQALAGLTVVSPFTFALVFLGGVISALSICYVPVLVMFSGMVIGKEERNQNAFPFSLAFTLGMALTSAGIGVVAALVGKGLLRLFTGYHLDQWIPATIGILMGLQLIGVLKLRIPMFGRMQTGQPRTTRQAFLLGLPFGFVVTPCTIPIFIIVIGVVAASANAWAGAAILVAYAVGKGVVLTVVALTSSTLVKSFIQRWGSKLERIAGFVLLASSIYLIFFQVKMNVPIG